jgi:Subtilase family
VKWAIDCKVDIISMSWDVEQTSRNLTAGAKLVTELTNASSQDILMFCSSSDNGLFSSSGRKFYPHCSTKCIKIGAAAWDGHGCAWVDDDVDFLLPGKDVPFTWASPEQMDPQDGSSLATALAAGLAGILQYAYKAFGPAISALRPDAKSLDDDDDDGDDDDDDDDDDEKGDIFKGQTPKNMDKMKELFTKLTNRENDLKYVHADRWFSVYFKDRIARERRDIKGRSGEDDLGSKKVSELGWNQEDMAGLAALLQEIWRFEIKT